ncbi:hypothetical protein ERK14_06580 [Lactobacillus kunkeei]|nr:hypothetical protein [Apilactobacillus kunkeei]
MTSYLSDTRIRSETQFWADRVHKLTSKIDDKNKLVNSLNSEIAAINATITNVDYVLCRSNYNDYNNQINQLIAERNQFKSKATENQLSSQINDLKSKKASCANKMKLIANTNGFINEFMSITEKTRNVNLISSLIVDLKQQRTAANKQREYWRKQSLV